METASKVERATGSAPVWFRGIPHRGLKRFRAATHRICAPEETLERIRPVLWDAGITRMADVTGLDRIGIPTVLAMRPNAPTMSNASGKGFTLAAAEVSAAMEGIELCCAEELARFTGEAVTATHAELAVAGMAIDAELFALSRFSLFHPEVPERWVLAWDLLGQHQVAVPLEMVTMAPALSQHGTRFSFQVGSNGLASGNSFLEATCAGLAEVIERDAVTTANLRAGHQLARLRRADVGTIAHERVVELVQRLRQRGVSPLLFDCTSDTMVPTFMAYLVDDELPSTGVYRGYGAHLDPEVAMIRALTEAVQSRAVYIAGSRDDLMTLDHVKLRRHAHQGAVGLAHAPGGEHLGNRDDLSTDSFEGDCHVLLGALRRVGLDCAAIVDLTRPEFGVSVVRVIVPGLEGYGSFAHYLPGPRGQAAAAAGAAVGS